MDVNVAKAIAIVLFFAVPVSLGCVSLIVYTKYRIKLNSSRKGASFLSYLNCFAGGFFLGTCLLVVLGEGNDKFEEYRHLADLNGPFPCYESAIGAGFFLVALTEKLIRLVFFAVRHPGRDESEGSARVADPEKIRIRETTLASRTTTYTESDDDLYENVDDLETSPTAGILPQSPDSATATKRKSEKDSPVSKNNSDAGGSGNFRKEDDPLGPSFSFLRVVMLCLALSFHTVFDGLTVGLQTEVARILTLMGALVFHKAVMSVVLGVELASVCNTQKLRQPVLALLTFSIASPLGVGVGMGVTSGHEHQSAQLLAGALMQAFATGVFLYVTCFEILERDMVSGGQGHGGVMRVCLAILGFLLIAAIDTASSAA